MTCEEVRWMAKALSFSAIRELSELHTMGVQVHEIGTTHHGICIRGGSQRAVFGQTDAAPGVLVWKQKLVFTIGKNDFGRRPPSKEIDLLVILTHVNRFGFAVERSVCTRGAPSGIEVRGKPKWMDAICLHTPVVCLPAVGAMMTPLG